MTREDCSVDSYCCLYNDLWVNPEATNKTAGSLCRYLVSVENNHVQQSFPSFFPFWKLGRLSFRVFSCGQQAKPASACRNMID